jgi:hypothetical protein
MLGELNWRHRPNYSGRVGPLVFSLLIVCLLFVGRWPMILQRYELNPDESQIIAGALTLRTDPVPWRSIDGMTTGPLSDYWLQIASYFAPLNFMVARIWAVLTFGGALILTYASIRRLTSDTVARWAVAPALLFATFTTHHDFAHYSSEHLPTLLLAAAVYALVRMFVGRDFRTSIFWSALSALLLGAQPWAKLQAVPIALSIGCVGLGWWFQSKFTMRQRVIGASTMITSSLAVSLAFATLLHQNGLWGDFLERYIAYVFEYTKTRPNSPLELLLNFGRYADHHSGITWLAAGAAVWLTIALCVTWRRGEGMGTGAFWLSLIYALSAFATCLISGRFYTHYLLLMVLPTVFLCGWMLHLVSKYASSISAENVHSLPLRIYFCALVLPPLVHRPYIPQPTMPVELPHADDAVSFKINQISKPGDRLTTWGWMAEYNVRTQLPQGARDAISVNQMEESTRREKATRDYVADLERNRTRFFVDAVAPGAFAYATPEWRHDRFPVIREYIATHYQLFDDHDGIRIYMRSEPANRLSVSDN